MRTAARKNGWRRAHPAARAASRRRYYGKTKDGPMRMVRWTADDVDRILAADRPPDPVLSAAMGRSVMSIQVKRHKVLKRRNKP